jgi:hypothetical protein
MDKKNNARQYVRELRTFYIHLTIYGAVSLLCVLLWVCMGGGAFWPLWVILGFATAAVLEGLPINKIPQLDEYLPFLSQEWERDQLRQHASSVENKKDQVSV